jgi:hypothetical protein
MISATCRLCATIDSKPIPCIASVDPLMNPVSWLGMNPFGIAVNR